MNLATVGMYIDRAKDEVRRIVDESKTDSRVVIARYTAAVAVNFTDWMGKTLPWARHELARHALTDNLRCETTQDHVGMLFRFARLSGATPEAEHYAHVAPAVEAIRGFFVDITNAGIRGVALCMVLENTSEVFIPDLARRATELGCSDLTYTDVHGEADVEHSEAFARATGAEMDMGYLSGEAGVSGATQLAVDLIRCIYE